MPRSLFLVGLVKSGSTLLNRLMKPLTEAAGFTFVAPANDMRRQGRDLRDAQVAFEAEGHAYGGFRNLPWPLPPFAADRTVLLVRDPRDALTSLYFSVAYSHRPPGTDAGADMLRGFEARRARAIGETIDAFVLDEAPARAKVIEETLGHLPPHRMYRYEEVIFAKAAWVADMLGYFGIDLPARRVAQVVARQDILPTEEAPLEHVRRVTPGDHREKLRPETIAALDEILAPLLRRLGYAAAPDP